MHSAIYETPREVRVRQVRDPRIERPADDVLARFTSAAGHGSNLHPAMVGAGA